MLANSCALRIGCLSALGARTAGRRLHVAKGSLSSSGSDQAREGRLVDALAVRGDEGRVSLR